MLPPFIIEELLRREKEKNISPEIFVELPLYEDPFFPVWENETNLDVENDGVAIIDFTI